MNTDESPFDILEISPWAELEVVNAAYKALARKYHPDMNPDVSPEELNKKMAKLNWAREQLEKDIEGWRKRVTHQAPTPKGRRTQNGASGSRPSEAQAQSSVVGMPEGIVQAEPPVVVLQGRKGSASQFKAWAEGLSASQIRARFKPGSIDVQRLSSSSSRAEFGVTVVEDFPSDVEDNAIETIELRAPGFITAKVFVSIAPISQTVLAQVYGKRVAPTRHISVSARISFGKHRGRPFREIAVEEPGYLEWMLREGAGSRVERECARLALAELRGRTILKPGPRIRPDILKGPTQSPQPFSLPDPKRPGGLWEVIKALFSPKEKG